MSSGKLGPGQLGPICPETGDEVCKYCVKIWARWNWPRLRGHWPWPRFSSGYRPSSPSLFSLFKETQICNINIVVNWWFMKIYESLCNAHSVLQIVTPRHTCMGGKVQNQILWKLGHLVLKREHNLSKWVDLPLISSVDALRAAHLHRGLATSCLAGSCSSLGPWSVYSASLRHHVSAKTAETGETGPDVSLCRDRGSLAFSQFRFEHYLQSRFSLGRPWKGWVKIYNVNMLVG